MSFLAAITLAGATAAAAAAPQPPATLQQKFDAATDAMVAGKCADAISQFEALEKNPKVKPGSIPAAAIQVRKGSCLIRVARLAEGVAAVQAGLPLLETAGQQYTADVAYGYVALGNAALVRTDYAESRRLLEKALPLQTGGDRIKTLSLLARAAAFDSGPEPLAYADEAIRLAEADAKPSKDLLAQLHALHARILLNRGQTGEAYAELKKALQLSGGLTSRTTIPETSLRGDLALAALQLNRKDDARLYLAWTGAGRIEQSPFASGAVMSPPDCGGEAGLKPDDVAVVEFGIGDNGDVAYAETVHAKGGPRVAAAFASAVRGWSWRPEQLAKIPVFYRASTRVELRCSTAGGSLPSIVAPLNERFVNWAAPRLGVGAQPEATPRSAMAASLKTMLQARERDGDAAGQVAAAGLLGMTDISANAETVASLDRALAAGEKAGVSAEALNVLRYQRLNLAALAEWVDIRKTRYHSPEPEDYLALLQNPAFAADPVASDVVLLTVADPVKGRRLAPESNEWLTRVADDGRLPDRHPLRQVARLKLANRAAAAGDLAKAQGYFASTGLTEQQCALIGAPPRLKSSGASSSDFPMEAMRYGFEGWVRLEFDISREGKPAGVRPIVAYPPFVFVDAAQGMSRDFRYDSTYRPAGGAACSAKQETVSFILPGG